MRALPIGSSRLPVPDLEKLCSVDICLFFSLLEFVEFKLKYAVPKTKAKVNPCFTFLLGACHLFFQEIRNLHMTHCKWEDRDFVIA